MKLKSIILIVLLLVKSNYPQQSWKWISPDPPATQIFSSVVLDSVAYFNCYYSSVMKMDLYSEKVEMISTYAPQNCGYGNANLQQLGFANSQIGYMSEGCYGQYRTVDGGYTWNKVSNAASNLRLVLFASDNIGWLLGDWGLYRTTDAGSNWSNKNAPFFNTGVFTKMFAMDTNRLWVLKSAYYDGNGASVWYSSNSGSNWTSVNTGLVSNPDSQVTYYDMKINSNGAGFIVGSIFTPYNYSIVGFILRTQDLGLTWTISYYPDERFVNIICNSDNEWFLLGNRGYYDNSQIIQRKTDDGGFTWQYSEPLLGIVPSSTLYTAIFSPVKNAIYLFASRGVYTSYDNGFSYKKMSSDLDTFVGNLAFESKPITPENQLAIAYSEYTSWPYLFSSDAGKTWAKRDFPTSLGNYLWRVGISEGTVYIIVDQTKLYKSTDQGITWQLLSLPVWNSGLQALNVYNKNILSLKAYPSLLSSTDGGLNWISGPVIENIWWKSTSIGSPGMIAGVGTYYDSSLTKGFIYQSSDYGLSWHIFDTSEELTKVQMTDDKVGYSISSRRLYKTSNSGMSWKSIFTAGNDGGIYQLDFTDSLNGILVEGYKFRQTTDGGKNWITTDFLLPIPGVQDMRYNIFGDLFLAGGGNMLMIPSNQVFSPEIKNTSNESVSEYYLSPSFPNPFNSSSTIKYYIPTTSQVTIKIFNTLGEEIETLVDEIKSTGTYQITWNAQGLTSGVYFYRLQSGTFTETKKMILLK